MCVDERAILITKALARENRNQRIGISPAKTQRPQRKEIIFIRTWRSSRLGGTNIRIRDVSYVRKFTQAAKTFKDRSTKHLCLFGLTSVSEFAPLLTSTVFT